MTVSNELYLAILALDAYNQRRFEQIKGVGSQVGLARQINASNISASNFSATAYQLDGVGKVISYRGTNDPLGDLTGGAWYGDPRGLSVALRWLLAEPFKDRPAYVVVRDAEGAAKVETVQGLAENAQGAPA